MSAIAARNVAKTVSHAMVAGIQQCLRSLLAQRLDIAKGVIDWTGLELYTPKVWFGILKCDFYLVAQPWLLDFW